MSMDCEPHEILTSHTHLTMHPTIELFWNLCSSHYCNTVLGCDCRDIWGSCHYFKPHERPIHLGDPGSALPCGPTFFASLTQHPFPVDAIFSKYKWGMFFQCPNPITKPNYLNTAGMPIPDCPARFLLLAPIANYLDKIFPDPDPLGRIHLKPWYTRHWPDQFDVRICCWFVIIHWYHFTNYQNLALDH